MGLAGSEPAAAAGGAGATSRPTGRRSGTGPAPSRWSPGPRRPRRGAGRPWPGRSRRGPPPPPAAGAWACSVPPGAAAASAEGSTTSAMAATATATADRRLFVMSVGAEPTPASLVRGKRPRHLCHRPAKAERQGAALIPAGPRSGGLAGAAVPGRRPHPRDPLPLRPVQQWSRWRRLRRRPDPGPASGAPLLGEEGGQAHRPWPCLPEELREAGRAARPAAPPVRRVWCRVRRSVPLSPPVRHVDPAQVPPGRRATGPARRGGRRSDPPPVV